MMFYENWRFEMLSDGPRIPKWIFPCDKILHVSEILLNDLVSNCGDKARMNIFKGMAKGSYKMF